MIRASVKYNKAYLRNLPERLNSITALTGLELHQLAARAAQHMENTIDTNRKRGKNYGGRSRLMQAIRSSIKIVRYGNQYSIRFMDKKQLDMEAPYWYVLNYGGMPWYGRAGGATSTYNNMWDERYNGVFDNIAKPTAGVDGGAWYPGMGDENSNSYMLMPKKPIEGILYIEKAMTWLQIQWGKVQYKVRQNLENIKREQFLFSKTKQAGTGSIPLTQTQSDLARLFDV